MILILQNSSTFPLLKRGPNMWIALLPAAGTLKLEQKAYMCVRSLYTCIYSCWPLDGDRPSLTCRN
jgi:hypothetical protein